MDEKTLKMDHQFIQKPLDKIEDAERLSISSEIGSISISNSLIPSAMLSQRIVSLEHYMAFPVKEFDNMYSEFRNSSVQRVPVIRIFGSTPAGQKMCANIHGVYPYVSILDDASVVGFKYRISAALDDAINESVNSNKFKNNVRKDIPTQHVFKVMRVAGRTFYGFQSPNDVFLRIFFYNPLILKKAVDLLQSGRILGRPFQPYEAHIPYSLQFMIDYSLYGMNFIHYSSVKFRRKNKNDINRSSEMSYPGPPSSQTSNGSNCSDIGFINPEELSPSAMGPSNLTCMTLCELEVDVIASDILIGSNNAEKAISVNPGIDSIWKDEIERRHQHGVEPSSQITIPESQERLHAILLHSAEEKHQEILWKKVDSCLANNDNEEKLSSQYSSNEASFLPSSSQIIDHLLVEGDSGKVYSEQDTRLTPEEDEFIKLLENMAAQVENDKSEEDCLENLLEEVDENDDSCNSDLEDSLWNDSLLNSSILERIADVETAHEKSRNDGKSESPTILQCDGQVDDSDISSDDDTPLSKSKREKSGTTAAKVSRRISERISKRSGNTSVMRKKKLSKTVHSPVDGLSLTRRRLSRSQEAKPSTSGSSLKNEKISKTTRKSLRGVFKKTCSEDLNSKNMLDTSEKTSEEPSNPQKKIAIASEPSPSACGRSMKGKVKPLHSIETAIVEMSHEVNVEEKNKSLSSLVSVVRSKRIAARKQSQGKESTKIHAIASKPVSLEQNSKLKDDIDSRGSEGKKKKRLGIVGISKFVKSASPTTIANKPPDDSSMAERKNVSFERPNVSTVSLPSIILRKADEIKPKQLIDIGITCKPSNASVVMQTDQQLNKTEDVKTKQLIDIGITCKPSNASVVMQTDQALVESTFVQVSPDVVCEGTQTFTEIVSSETQTDALLVSVETQTDAVVPLCLCQCTCVVKEKSDQGVEVQVDLKPVMENKRIQVDNVDIINRARSARFTTPQNKIRFTTPLRSPEKRRPLTESPKRRQLTTPTSSRYLSALILKTPTSMQKSSRTQSRADFISTDSPDLRDVVTPPSRESKEGYLIKAIRTASASPKKRTSSAKPRNLDAEVNRASLIETLMLEEEVEMQILNDISTSSGSKKVAFPDFSAGQVVDALNSPDVDLSVNSVYEYEEESVANGNISSPFTASAAVSPAATLSAFQRKRIQSKHRSKNRLEKRKTANLEANRAIPDVFKFEYEPLKQPTSYKSTIKWLEAENHRGVAREKYKLAEIEDSKEPSHSFNNESSDEEAPPPIKLFGGGNLSDDDDEFGVSSSSSLRNSQDIVMNNDIKPFTPEFSVCISDNDCSSQLSTNTSETPRSILRQGGNTRRNKSVVILKRKIRWEDEEPTKKIKIEQDGDYKRETDHNDISVLTNESLNKTVDISELDGPTLKNAIGLENSMSNLQDVKALHQCQFITTLSVEVHCESRNGLTPDPAIDAVLAIFVLVSSDYPENFRKSREFMTILMKEDVLQDCGTIDRSQSIKTYSNEIAMFEDFISLVRFWDPDILLGYEVEKSSYGFLIRRGHQLGKDLQQDLSRILPFKKKNGEKEFTRAKEEWNCTINGRIVLNLWRLLRNEMAVQSYTFENAAYHILRRRVYKFSNQTLTSFWSQNTNRYKVIQYYTIRVRGAIQIMEKLDLINRTSELARLFGIQFNEVLSRGSQFRVESMMLRATKPLDYIAPSPTISQRARMMAPECLPLILEPQSNYYTDPVAVLDFQSLYPSMMIAYNYDYASLLGRVEHLGSLDRFALGCLDHYISPSELRKLKNNIHVSPVGVAFLDKSVVKGVLPEMLEQILETRQMVKRAMKRWKNEGASLQKVLDSRQLGLKLIANVTYGYTSANFSGRMPCVEIADSIVSKGRETLQRAIDHVKSNYHRWGADVVYGDTDSLFVLFKGRSKDEAFKLAYEIADEVTQANPKPVKLKFEKIYQPCILQSKKRYVGYAYETPDQKKPIYDAKGIETVRRDGCPAVRKILEKTLHVLFTTNKRQSVQDYVTSQFEKLFKGRVSLQDYIFAREFRGRDGYKPGASVPSLEIAKRLTEKDPKADPLVSERVPYVVVYGIPSLPLIKLVRTPGEFTNNTSLRLNAHYYIGKVIIPALNRCLILAGIDATKWLTQLPRKYLRTVLEYKPKGQGTLDDYVLHQNCLHCDEKTERGLCSNCLSDETKTVTYLQEVLRTSKSKLDQCVEICTNCAGEARSCVSYDCPIFHKLMRYDRDQPYMKKVERELANLEW